MTRRTAGSPRTGVAACVLVLLVAPAARAFTIDTIVTRGCHEEMTAAALRTVRAELPTADPLPPSREDRAFIDDLAFTAPDDMKDLGGATLLIGVRDNDLEGQDGNDLTRLALVHGDPRAQRKHCLHAGAAPEPEGSIAALADCRAFILDRLAEALEGLDDAGRPDPTRRTSLPVYLGVRNRVDVSLQTFYVRIGQAIHAVQDSFAHSYRTNDAAAVTAMMNWFDQVNGGYDEATDGPPHTTELDRCDDPDDLRHARRLLATETATTVLRIALDPARSRDQKMADVAARIDEWFRYEQGCSAENRWCDAPERDFASSGVVGCGVAPPGAGRWGTHMALALVALAILRRPPRRRRGALLLLASLATLTGSARAERAAPAPGARAAAAARVPPPVITPVAEPGPYDRSRPAFGGYLGGAGALTDPALATALGARLRASLHWTFGVDLEWNPWLSVNGAQKVRAGALNLYATAIFRVPLAYQRFNLRVTANIGASRTLMDLYGVPKGSIGPFGALYPLGLEWKASSFLYVILNPLGVAAPIPQIEGIPFWYPQYRVTIGVEVYAG